MNPVLSLAPRLQRAAGRDGRVTTALAVLAFAVTTALTTSVLAATLAFAERAEHPTTPFERDAGDTYVLLAVIATVLLVVPLLTLGGAAARLGVARRHERLAALRLLGATPREVLGLTVLETAGQGLVGAVLGSLLYGALLPVWTSVPFQERTFSAAELWVGPRVLGLVWLAVPLLAAVSGAVSLRQVVVSPLGVARRVRPPALRAARVVGAVVAFLAFVVVSTVREAFAAAAAGVLVGMLAVAFAAVNAVGPWLLALLGRRAVRRARTPAQLLAARRLLDDPRAVWRVVGGLALASFVAGVLAVVPALAQGPQDDPVVRDVLTGALLTLGIAFLLAAASAGIAQAASVLDRRRELSLARLAGVPVELFDAVRRREVLVPVLVASVGSAGLGLALMLPLFGFAVGAAPQGLVLLVASLAVGTGLVLAATESARPLLRRVLATPVVRAD